MTKYGYSTIFIAFIIFCALVALSFITSNNIAKWALILSGIIILAFTLNFFRDPERTPPQQKNAIVSPADGTVLFVKEVEETKIGRAHV